MSPYIISQSTNLRKKMAVFGDVVQSGRWMSTSTIRAMMDTTSISETSVNFYQTIRRNIPHGSHLHTRRRKNIKSNLRKFFGI
jgi:hypothetical protein